MELLPLQLLLAIPFHCNISTVKDALTGAPEDLISGERGLGDMSLPPTPLDDPHPREPKSDTTSEHPKLNKFRRGAEPSAGASKDLAR